MLPWHCLAWLYWCYPGIVQSEFTNADIVLLSITSLMVSGHCSVWLYWYYPGIARLVYTNVLVRLEILGITIWRKSMNYNKLVFVTKLCRSQSFLKCSFSSLCQVVNDIYIVFIWFTSIKRYSVDFLRWFLACTFKNLYLEENLLKSLQIIWKSWVHWN